MVVVERERLEELVAACSLNGRAPEVVVVKGGEDGGSQWRVRVWVW